MLQEITALLVLLSRAVLGGSLPADILESIVMNIGTYSLNVAPNMLYRDRQPLHAQTILALAGVHHELRASIQSRTELWMHSKLARSPCIPCVVCAFDCVKTCNGCKKAFYCSRKCQRKHWPKHAASCKKFQMKCRLTFPALLVQQDWIANMMEEVD